MKSPSKFRGSKERPAGNRRLSRPATRSCKRPSSVRISSFAGIRSSSQHSTLLRLSCATTVSSLCLQKASSIGPPLCWNENVASFPSMWGESSKGFASSARNSSSAGVTRDFNTVSADRPGLNSSSSVLSLLSAKSSHCTLGSDASGCLVDFSLAPDSDSAFLIGVEHAELHIATPRRISPSLREETRGPELVTNPMISYQSLEIKPGTVLEKACSVAWSP